MALAALGASWMLTDVVRRYAMARAMLDVPNDRSSHQVPTPRGGGLAIAVVTLLAIALLGFGGLVPPDLSIALAGGGVIVATVGWIDDHGGLPASVRAASHFVAGGWALYWVGGLPSLQVGLREVSLGPVGAILALIAVVWCVNLYNFMDGIDGLAAGEAVTAGLFGGSMLLFAENWGLAAITFAIAAATGGFLAWNWAPAKIFMGDVGSGLLGFLFAAVAIASENAGAVPLLVWLLLLGVFAFDATVTLFRRLVRRERWYDAHRSHAYQRAVRAGWTHKGVTTFILALNVALGTIAWISYLRPHGLLFGLSVALAVLVSIYLAVERICPMQSK